MSAFLEMLSEHYGVQITHGPSSIGMIYEVTYWNEYHQTERTFNDRELASVMNHLDTWLSMQGWRTSQDEVKKQKDK